MKHQRQFGTLLAVTLAAAPVAASPDRTPRARPPATTAAPPPGPSMPPVAGPQAPSVVQHLVNSLVILARTAARPRELPSGAPACGNVATRTGVVKRCK